VDEPSKDPNIILSTLSSYIFCLLNSWPAGVLGRVIWEILMCRKNLLLLL